MIWDQTYGDFGTYEEAQITTAAKGADAMNPGVTMNLVVKSGSNTFKRPRLGELSVGRLPEHQRRLRAARQGLRAGRQQVHELQGLLRRSRRTDPAGSPLVLRQPPRRVVRQLHSRVSFASPTAQQVEFYTKLQDPTGKVTYQMTKNNKVEGMFQFGRKWQPYRTASRFVPLESTQNQDSWSLVGPSFKWQSVLSPALDVRRELAARRLLVAGHSVDAGRPQGRT